MHELYYSFVCVWVQGFKGITGIEGLRGANGTDGVIGLKVSLGCLITAFVSVL